MNIFIRAKLNDPTSNFEWEYILIEKNVRNAWCMPGGKIAVYTGMFDVTKNTNGLAAVMGHEIAHAVAKHSVERASRGADKYRYSNNRYSLWWKIISSK